MLSLFNIKSGTPNQELVTAIRQVSSEFEKVYTSINKFSSSVSEGAEQVAAYTLSLKKKLQELKKVLINQQEDGGTIFSAAMLCAPGNVSAEAAAKNAEMVKLQEKIRSLKLQGKTTEVPALEKKVEECSDQFKSLMSPEATQLQKSAICRSIVGIVDTLGQVVFRTVSDQFSARDSIKSYLVSAIDAKKLTTGKEKEEKGTVERMSALLLKSAGVFLEFGKQVGLDLPSEYESQIKMTHQNGASTSSTTPTIADYMQKIDTHVRHLNQVSRNEKIDALLVDELLRDVEDLIITMKVVEAVTTRLHRPIQQAVTESQAAVNVAEYEANPTGFKIPPIRSTEEAVAKLKALIDVLHEYLVPCLVATPLVYLQDKDWGLKSHAEFRAARRKELKDLEPHVTASMPLDALRECISEFCQILILVLHVKIPVMNEVHPDDSSIFTRVKWSAQRQALREDVAAEVERLQSPKSKNSPPAICMVVQNLVRVLMRFLTFKPVGRPHVFRSDAEWTLVSESKLRFQLRKELLL